MGFGVFQSSLIALRCLSPMEFPPIGLILFYGQYLPVSRCFQNLENKQLGNTDLKDVIYHGEVAPYRLN